MEKQYWKGLEELRNDPEFERIKNQEFAEELPLEEIFSSKAEANNTTGRRDFLKLLGFGVGVATLAACETPVRKTIPYLIKPEEIVPGVANYYASTYFDGRDYCSIVVKTREGRPIKIEGNDLSPVTGGGTSARVQASVLSLYDSSRLKTPMMNREATTWNNVDSEVKNKLSLLYGSLKPVEEVKDKKGKVIKNKEAKATGKTANLRILSSTIISPSTKAVIGDFINRYPGTRHITYDAVSFSGMRMANEATFGTAMIPTYRFDNAKTIVSIGADFLANWLSPIEYSKQYVAKRKLRGSNKEAAMSKHIQIESALSLTGSNADKRIAVKPSEMGAVVLSLYNKIASKAGEPTYGNAELGKAEESIKDAANELWNSKGSALVVSGSNDKDVQILVNEINKMLGSYGVTIDTTTPSHLQQGNDAEVKELIEDMNNGKVDGLILYGVNPYYTMGKAQADAFKTGCAKVGLKVTFADREDETAAGIDGFIVAPDNHFLESWNDAEPKRGHVSLTQPTINPLFSTRAAQESLMIWAGNENKSYHDYIQDYWKKNFFHESSSKEKHLMFGDFWNKSLQDGVIAMVADAAPAEKGKDKPKEVKETKKDKAKEAPKATNKAAEAASSVQNSSKGNGFELLVYEKVGLGIGNQANNPWLQELPDPISKVCWDNYLALSPGTAKKMNFKQGDVATVSINGYSVEVVVLEQPGQAADTGSLAIGYGRTNAGKTSSSKTKVIGVNAYPFTQFVNGSIQYFVGGVTVAKVAGKTHGLAATQTHHTMMGRPVVKEASLEEYRKDAKAGNETEMVVTMDGKQKAEDVDLWASKENPGHPRPNHQWGLSIDLNSCIGCGSCVIACTAENNVPVVGKLEVIRSREMHWMRIDRYYSSDAKKGDLSNMEHPAEQPQVVFQPIMCQHCNHAPCETVCPVIATSHSSEGLNQMTYNRCVGTRYCANNCPYKVRRFNWFKYSDNPKFDFNMNDDLGKMVLNPDVVVRSRGVMEKCSMCVQRIQETKLVAKKDKRKIKDGEIKMACSQACPTDAITFGDWNDTNSELSKQGKEERSYHLLEELDVKPNVVYLTKIRNAEEAKA